MVKLEIGKEEGNGESFGVSRLLVSRKMFHQLKREIGGTQKELGVLSYLTLKSVNLSELEFSEDAIKTVIKAIDRSPEEGRESIDIDDTPISRDIYERYSEEEEDSIDEFVRDLNIRDDVKRELINSYDSIENLKSASQEELQEINGIGETTAESIREAIQSE